MTNAIDGICVGSVVRLDGIALEMTTLERVGVASIVEKMMETRLKWFGNM